MKTETKRHLRALAVSWNVTGLIDKSTLNAIKRDVETFIRLEEKK